MVAVLGVVLGAVAGGLGNMKTRAAILWQSHKPLIIDDVQIPTLKRGQVLVKIYHSGICRAQYNEIIALKGPDRFLPHLLGHEASGEIVDISKGVTKVKKGDYVCLSWIKGKGLDGINSQYKLGSKIVNAGGVTTFSDYAVVSENRVTKIPKTMPKDIAAILGCAVLTGCGIVDQALDVAEGSSLAVFGVGGVGLSVLAAAKRRQCQTIIAVDISDDKIAFAKRFGVTHGLNATKVDVVKSIARIAPNGIDYAVDASGSKKAMEQAFASVKEAGGQCLIAGNLSQNEKIEIHPFDLIKGKQLKGTWGGQSVPDRDIPRYVRSFQKGQLPLKAMITHHFPLEKINDAFDVLVQGQAGRIVLDMKG